MSKEKSRKYFRDIDPDAIELIHQQLNDNKIQLIINKPLVLAMKKYKIASLLPIILLPFYFLMDMIIELIVDLGWLSYDFSSILGATIVPLILVFQIILSQFTKNKLYQFEVQFKSKIMDIKPVMEAIYGVFRAEGLKEFNLDNDNYFSEIKSNFSLNPDSISFLVTHKEPVESIILYGKKGNLEPLKLSLAHMIKIIEGGVPEEIFNLNPTTVQLDYDQKKMTIKGKDTTRWEEMTKKTFSKKQIIVLVYIGILLLMFTTLIIFTENTGLVYFLLSLALIIVVFPTKLSKFSINNKVIRIKLHTHFDPIYTEYALKNKLKKYFDEKYMTYKDHPGSYEDMKLYFMWGKTQLFQVATQFLDKENTYEMAIIVNRKYSRQFFSNLQMDLSNFLVFNDQEKLLDRLYPEEEDILSKRDKLIRDIQDAEITKKEKQIEKVASLNNILKNMNFKKLAPLGIALLLFTTVLILSTSVNMDQYIVYQETSQFHDFRLELDQYSYLKIKQLAIESVQTQNMFGHIAIEGVDTEYMNWQNWENRYHYDREYWLIEDSELRIVLNSNAEFEMIIYAGYNHPSTLLSIIFLLFMVFIIPLILFLQIHNKDGENTILAKLYPKTKINNEIFAINAMTSPDDLGAKIGIPLYRIVIFEVVAQMIFFGLLMLLTSQDILTTQIMSFYSLGLYESPIQVKSIYLIWTALTLYVLAGRKTEGTSLNNISSIHIVISFIILLIFQPGMQSYLGLAIESYI